MLLKDDYSPQCATHQTLIYVTWIASETSSVSESVLLSILLSCLAAKTINHKTQDSLKDSNQLSTCLGKNQEQETSYLFILNESNYNNKNCHVSIASNLILIKQLCFVKTFVCRSHLCLY